MIELGKVSHYYIVISRLVNPLTASDVYYMTTQIFQFYYFNPLRALHDYNRF